MRWPLFLYSFGTDSIADAQQPAELVDGASAFIDQSGICQIARRQPIAVVAFYLKRPPRRRLMPSLEPSFRTRTTTRQGPKKCALSFGLMPICAAKLLIVIILGCGNSIVVLNLTFPRRPHLATLTPGFNLDRRLTGERMCLV